MDGLVIPPLLLYAFGAVLTIMGGLRAWFLGWKQRPDVPEAAGSDADDAADDQEDGSGVAGEVRGTTRGTWSDGKTSGHKRHLTMGAIWVALGLFLIISTAVNGR